MAELFLRMKPILNGTSTAGGIVDFIAAIVVQRKLPSVNFRGVHVCASCVPLLTLRAFRLNVLTFRRS